MGWEKWMLEFSKWSSFLGSEFIKEIPSGSDCFYRMGKRIQDSGSSNIFLWKLRWWWVQSSLETLYSWLNVRFSWQTDNKALDRVKKYSDFQSRRLVQMRSKHLAWQIQICTLFTEHYVQKSRKNLNSSRTCSINRVHECKKTIKEEERCYKVSIFSIEICRQKKE